MEKITGTDRVRSEDVLQRVKEKRNILHIVERGKLTELVTSYLGTVF